MTTETPRRRGGTVLDMVRSLAVVLLLVGVIALITLRPGDPGDPHVINYGTELAAARASAPYEILAPADVDDYQATSVRYEPSPDGTVWHLGFVSPAERYVGLDQTDGDPDPFVDELTEGARPVASDGAVVLGGRTWERYDGGGDAPDEDVRGLVANAGDVTTVVSGTAEWPELEEFAAALE